MFTRAFVAIILFFSYSYVGLAKQPLKVVVNIYNLTGQTQQISGHQEPYYSSSAKIHIAHDAEQTKANKPSTISVQPKERGHMYRMHYDIRSIHGSCRLDFVIRWNSRQDRYNLENVTARGSNRLTCPLSPVKHDEKNNGSQFSMAILHR